MNITPKVARTFRRLSQEQVAEIIGESKETYMSIEKNPSLATVGQAIALSKALAISYDQIFFG